jgi:hypothetical protein
MAFPDSGKAAGESGIRGCDVPTGQRQSSTVAPTGFGGAEWDCDRAGRVIAGRHDPLKDEAFAGDVPEHPPRRAQDRWAKCRGQSSTNRTVHTSNIGPGLRASSMLDIAAGFLLLVSVGIFVAHAVDTYRTQ